MAKSNLEETLEGQLRWLGLAPIRDHRFHPTRRWRFDFAFVEVLLAVEIEGGIYVGGRHTRGAGYRRDCQKYNAACLLGWRILRYTRQEIESGEAAREIADFVAKITLLTEGTESIRVAEVSAQG